MNIDQPAVKGLSDLARIAISDQEAKIFAEQLPQILDYMAQLQKVDVRVVPDLTARAMNLRPDQADASLVIDQLLQAAPDHQDQWWKVKPVL